MDASAHPRLPDSPRLTMNSKLLTAFVLASLTACGSTPPKQVDNALLAQASAESRAAIASARSERDVAIDEMAIATAEANHAADEVEMAKLALRTASAESEQSKKGVEIAETTGTPDQLKKAAELHSQKLALEEVAKAVLAVEKQELQLAENEQEAAELTHELRLAQVEEAKAIAVQDVNLVEVRDIELTDFRNRVAKSQRAVDVAKESIVESNKRLKVANEKLSKASAHARAVGADSPMLGPAESSAPKPAPKN